MADSTLELNSGSGGGKLAIDVSGSALFQYVKVTFGASGTQTRVDGTNPLPVYLAGAPSLTQTFVVTGPSGAAVTVGGTVSVTGSHSVLLSGPVSLTGSFMDGTNNAFRVNVVAGSAAGTEFNEDSAHSTGHAGIEILAVRRDTPAVGSDTDGDYSTVNVDASGRLWTHGLVSLTGSVQVAGITNPISLSSSYTVVVKNMHTADFDTGAGTDTTPAFGIAVPANGGAAVVPGDATAGLKVDLGADNDVTVTSGLVSLTGSVSVFISNTVNTEVVGDVSLTGSMSVVISSGTVTIGAGTANIGTVSLSGSTSVVIKATTNTIEVVGDAAHDAAVAGNPLLQGFEARTTNPTAVANGDAVRAMADDLGRQVVYPFAPRDLHVVAHLTSLSASTTQTLFAAAGAGVFRDLIMLTLSNRSANVADVVIYDGLTTGTQRFRFELAADGGGAVVALNAPFPQATANNGWAIKSTELDVSVTAQAVDTV